MRVLKTTTCDVFVDAKYYRVVCYVVKQIYTHADA